MNEIISKKDVATLLKCGDQFIYKLIKDGTLEGADGGITKASLDKLTHGATKVCTIEEMAKKEGLSTQTILNRVNAGKIDSFKIGRLIRIPVRDAEADAKVTATKKTPVGKQTKESPRRIVKKIPVGDLEIVISVGNYNEESSADKLIKEFVKAWMEKSDLADRIEQLMKLME